MIIRLIFTFIFIMLLSVSAKACDLKKLEEILPIKDMTISGKVNRSIQCKLIQKKIITLLNGQQESIEIQRQVQNLYYIDEYLLSIQIQYIEVENDIRGQIQVYSF